MAGVTQDMILEYIQRKGGRVKNVDLVKHFRKHLLYDDPVKKEQARDLFKETVNSIAFIKQEEGEKFLYLKDEYKPNSSVPASLPPSSPPALSPSKPRRDAPSPPAPSPLKPRRDAPSPPSITPLNRYTTPTVPSPSLGRENRGDVPMKFQNGGGSHDFHPEQKSLSPKHRGQGPGSPLRQNRFANSSNKPPLSPSHQGKSSPLNSPLLNQHPSYNSPSIYSASVPVASSDFFQHGSPSHSFFPSHHFGHTHSPLVSHQSGGKGNKKMSLEISSPISVQPLSNGSAMADSSDLQKVMADLENIGRTSFLQDGGYLSSVGPMSHLSSHTDVPSSSRAANHAFPPSLPAAHSSENSSLSSSSVQSTSSPPSSEQNFTSPPSVTVTHSTSRSSQLGVQALIQQYTVPPGSVLSPAPTAVSPSRNSSSGGSPSKVQRSTSSASAHSTSSGGGSGLQLKREPTPPDVRVQRSHSNAGVVIRRSKGLEARNTNLDTLTRQSIRASSASHQKLVHRLSRNSDELMMSNSKEELLSEEHDRESPIDEYIIEIDVLEKEWMQALIDSNTDVIHRILMDDSSYVNRKGFLNGWTAVHWAAKLGNAQLLEALMFSGGRLDVKSYGGSTPLHLAAEAGQFKLVEILVNEYGASINARNHSGLRPIDMIDPLAPSHIKSMLRRGLAHRGLPPINASIAKAAGIGTRGHRLPSKQWNSVGHLSDREITEKQKKQHLASPKGVKKGISFRRKNKYQVNKKDKGKRNSAISENFELYDQS